MKDPNIEKLKFRPQKLKALAFQYFQNAKNFKKARKKKKKEK